MTPLAAPGPRPNEQEDLPGWQYETVRVAGQTDNVSCGVHTIVNLLHLVTRTPFPLAVDIYLYRRIFKAMLLQRQQPPQQPLPSYPIVHHQTSGFTSSELMTHVTQVR